MRTAIRYWAWLVLLATAPVLASANDLDLERGSNELARPVSAQAPAVADDASPTPPAWEDTSDPLLSAEFDEGFDLGEERIVPDPFEKTNRVTFKFNRAVHHWVLSPITKGYQFVVPEPARKSVRRALINLNSPSILVNDLLQLRFKDAAQTLGRFLLNSTIGMGGLFDVAVEAGWEYQHADFGQTLARAGVGSGPYLIIPVLGPNTLRDGVGDIVDLFMQPLTYLVGPFPNLVLGGGRGFAELEAKSEAMEALEESSVDYYAALRSAYMQNRRAEIASPDERGFD